MAMRMMLHIHQYHEYSYSLNVFGDCAFLNTQNEITGTEAEYKIAADNPTLTEATDKLTAMAFELTDADPLLMDFAVRTADNRKLLIPKDKAKAVLDALAAALDSNPDVEKTVQQSPPLETEPEKPSGNPFRNQAAFGAADPADIIRNQYSEAIPPERKWVCRYCGSHETGNSYCCDNCGAPHPNAWVCERCLIPNTWTRCRNCMRVRPDYVPEIRKIRLDGEPGFELTVFGESSDLSVKLAPDDTAVYCFPDTHPALTEALSRIVPEIFTEPDGSAQRHEILYTDSRKQAAEPEALRLMFEALRAALDADETVRVTHKDPTKPVVIPRLGMMGVMGFPGSMFFGAPVTAAPPPAPKEAVLHPDGTWDCICGKQNVPTKYCSECGAEKPEGWVCSCGNVNTGIRYSKFCGNCGAPKP